MSGALLEAPGQGSYMGARSTPILVLYTPLRSPGNDDLRRGNNTAPQPSYPPHGSTCQRAPCLIPPLLQPPSTTPLPNPRTHPTPPRLLFPGSLCSTRSQTRVWVGCRSRRSRRTARTTPAASPSHARLRWGERRGIVPGRHVTPGAAFACPVPSRDRQAGWRTRATEPTWATVPREPREPTVEPTADRADRTDKAVPTHTLPSSRPFTKAPRSASWW